MQRRDLKSQNIFVNIVNTFLQCSYTEQGNFYQDIYAASHKGVQRVRFVVLRAWDKKNICIYLRRSMWGSYSKTPTNIKFRLFTQKIFWYLLGYYCSSSFLYPIHQLGQIKGGANRSLGHLQYTVPSKNKIPK